MQILILVSNIHKKFCSHVIFTISLGIWFNHVNGFWRPSVWIQSQAYGKLTNEQIKNNNEVGSSYKQCVVIFFWGKEKLLEDKN